MKKNIEKILCIVLLNLLLIVGVDAATLEFDGKTNLTIKENETQKIDVKIKLDNAEKDIKKIQFDVIYNSSLLEVTQNKLENGEILTNYNKNSAYIQKIDDKDFESEVVFSLNVKNVSSEDKTGEVLEIKNIKINGEAVTGNLTKNLTLQKQVTTTTRKPNTSAKLTDFSVTNATIKPAFSPDKKEYKIYTNKDSIRQITIIPKFEESGVMMSTECNLGCTADAGKLSLIMGKNEATFTFTSEDGKNTEEYKFIIYRGPTTDGSNLLSALEIEGVELNETFDKSNLDYTATVPYETEKLEINATAEDENADIKIKGNESLSVGENVITITVTSTETNERKIYNITVIREEFKPAEETNTVVAPKIEKKNNNNLWKILIIIFISLLIIGLSAYFIFFKKDKKKKKDLKKTDNDAIDVKEKDPLLNNPIIDEDKEPTSVEDALVDLMKTKEMEIGK